MYRDTLLHRRRSVQGQKISHGEEYTGIDNFHRGRNVQGLVVTQEKECTGTGHYRKSEQLTRTFAVLVTIVLTFLGGKKNFV